MKYFTDMRTFLSSRTYFTLLIISVLLLSAGCGIFQKCPPDTNCPQEQKTATPPSPVATTISESHMELPGREEKPKAELPPAPPVISEPRVRPVVPSIDKALHEVTPEGSIVFELRGRKFSENASVEIFDSSARLVNHVALPGKDNKVRKFTLKLATPLSPGNYSLKVKNADGATSNAVSFTIVAAAKPTRQPEKATPKCGGSATPGAKVVFLSGGGVREVVQRISLP